MKLDSEQQREDLLELLSTVRAVVTPATIDAAKAEFDRILNPIREAEIEVVRRPVVPIESLAPDLIRTPGPLELVASGEVIES